MPFWILAALLLALVTALLLVPLLRRPAGDSAVSADVAIYKAQLSEIDRDVERGIVDADEAERTRVEIGRRLLAADMAAGERATQAPRGASMAAMAAIATVLIAGTSGLYLFIGAPGAADLPLQARIDASEDMRSQRISQLQAEQRAAENPLPRPTFPDDYLALVDQLRTIVPTRPDDMQGWAMLARHETALQNYSAAARAQERVIILRGEDATAEDYLILANQMVAAAQGYISPETENILRIILERDPSNTGARYYYGQLFFETDRPDRAFRLFRDVVNNGASDDPFVQLSRQLIEEAAFRAGVEYTLPPANGPTLEDIDAATDLSEEERAAMIEGMVAGLMDRLANEGGPVEDWARLITSLSVMGDMESAEGILLEARDLFGAFPEALEVLDFAAEQAGLSE